jgi:hypothetical protein
MRRRPSVGQLVGLSVGPSVPILLTSKLLCPRRARAWFEFLLFTFASFTWYITAYIYRVQMIHLVLLKIFFEVMVAALILISIPCCSQVSRRHHLRVERPNQRLERQKRNCPCADRYGRRARGGHGLPIISLGPAGGLPLKRPHGRFKGGLPTWPAAVFYPFGHPILYAYADRLIRIPAGRPL